VWTFSYTDFNGKRVRPHFPSRSEALAAKMDVEKRLRLGGVSTINVEMTFGEIAAQWLKTKSMLGLDGERLERSTLEHYRNLMEMHLCDPGLGISNFPLSDIRSKHLLDMKERLLGEGNRSIDRVRRVLKLARTILNYAVAKELIAGNPASDIRLKRNRRHEHDRDFPARAELQQIMLSAYNSWAAKPGCFPAYVIVGLSSGLRPSELRGLRGSDIKDDRRTIVVRQRADQYNRIGKTKSKSSRRIVDIGPRAAALLDQWLRLRPMGRLDLVFPNGAGNPESYQNILHRHWIPFCQGLGLTRPTDKGNTARYSLNCLRHGAVSIRIWQGWQPKQIQVFAGHSSIQVTMDIYGHLWREEAQARSMATAIEDELFRSA
jgi:integrase